MTLRLAAAGAVLLLLGAGASDPAANLRAVAAAYYADVGQIAHVTGRDTTMDYYQRLLDDADAYGQGTPPGYDPLLWRQSLDSFADLDLSLATQLLHRRYVALGSIRGSAKRSSLRRRTARCSRLRSTFPRPIGRRRRRR